MKRNRLPIGIAVFLWDSAWKIVAVRAALKNRQYRWIAPLVLANTVGILPILYLVKWAEPRGPFEEEGAEA